MTEIAYEIISHVADDMRCWQEQFNGYSLEHLEDICYNYLNTDDMPEEDRVRTSHLLAGEIHSMIQTDMDSDDWPDDDEGSPTGMRLGNAG